MQSELGASPWFSNRKIHFSVHDGVVRLQGSVSDERMRATLPVAAQNVSGRAEVEDELDILDPTGGMLVSP